MRSSRSETTTSRYLAGGAPTSPISARFAQHFPGATQVRLEENFRRTGNILAAANAVIERDQSRLGKTLYTRKQAGTPIEIVRFNSGEAEADEITKEIVRRRADGASWGEFAVLY